MTNNLQLLTVNQTASMLNLHHDTVRQYIREGRIPAFKIGGAIRLKQYDIEQFINKNQIVPDMNYESLRKML